MRLLFLGDVVGRSGRDAVTKHLPQVRASLQPDLVVVNGENAAGGFGITEAICQELHGAGTDVITTGNHVWDQRQIVSWLAADARILRPCNFPTATPGRGAGVYTTARGRKVMVINAMGRIFMDPLDCPFAAIERELAPARLGANVDAILVDFHAEATSEKMAMGHFLDGRVRLVVGTHSHVPTADAQVLNGGTAYQTDAGMCGDYDSVIGMVKAEPLQRFTKRLPTGRMEAASGEATMCGTIVETDDATGRALRIAPVRLGGRLAPNLPDW